MVVVPKRRLLPRAPRTGIVINLPEHRLYWYPPVAAGKPPVVWTFPVSIGKMDWNTPLGRTTIVAKVKEPDVDTAEIGARGTREARRDSPGDRAGRTRQPDGTAIPCGSAFPAART